MQKFLFLTLALFTATSSFAQTLRFKIESNGCSAEKTYVDEVSNKITDPILKSFHKILMDNELSGGCGALQFTDAEMASQTNGFSFGPSQFDLATRAKQSMDALDSILNCAAKEAGATPITTSDRQFLLTYGSKPTSQLKQMPEVWNRFGALRKPIESALASPCGKKILADSYISEINSFLPSARSLWQTVLKSNRDLSAAEPFFMLYALDLRNVLGGAEGFKKYVNDRNAIVCFGLCAQKIVPRYEITGATAVTDFIRYPLQATCYGFVPEQTRRYDALRRLNRVLVEVDLAQLPLTEKDKAYLVGEFADILANTAATHSNLPISRLKELVKLANGGTEVAGTNRPMSSENLNKVRDICKPKA